MSKFKNVKIENLTDSECRELLGIIQSLVSELPSFIELDRDCGYGRYIDSYTCCSGYMSEGHTDNCSINELNLIFG